MENMIFVQLLKNSNLVFLGVYFSKEYIFFLNNRDIFYLSEVYKEDFLTYKIVNNTFLV